MTGIDRTFKDGWIALTSDGKLHTEEWISGGNSPWSSLMHLCEQKNLSIEGLRLWLGGKLIALPANQQGYWQAHGGSTTTTGIQQINRGIGYVAAGICNIIWGTYDEHGNPFFWEEKRLPTDAQIIWSKDAHH